MKYKVFNGVYWCMMSCVDSQDFAEKASDMLRAKYGHVRVVKSGRFFLTYCPVIANYVGGGLEYTIVPI